MFVSYLDYHDANYDGKFNPFNQHTAPRGAMENRVRKIEAEIGNLFIYDARSRSGPIDRDV